MDIRSRLILSSLLKGSASQGERLEVGVAKSLFGSDSVIRIETEHFFKQIKSKWIHTI